MQAVVGVSEDTPSGRKGGGRREKQGGKRLDCPSGGRRRWHGGQMGELAIK